MELEACVRCGSGLKQPKGINVTGDQQIAFYLHATTVGIRPRIISVCKRIVICMKCAVAIAMSPMPEGAFNVSAHEILSDMNAKGRTIIEAAWDQKINPHARPKLMPGSKPDETLATTEVLGVPILTAAS